MTWCNYSVVIDRPIADVFPTLGYGENLESVVRLSSLCTEFQLLQYDTVQLPASTSLSQSRVRTQAPHEAEKTSNTPSDGLVLPRQSFRLQETVPIFFGLFTRKVDIRGTMTWDNDAKVSLYESIAESQGVEVWKLREFIEVEEDGKKKTRVNERIEGNCPWWMKIIVRKLTAQSHREHMDRFHTLC